jgi:hypothetical protein
LQKDEDFGTYTAALYVPQKEHLLLEFNNSGARYGRIGDYISAYSGVEGKSYTLSIVLGNGITAKALKKRNIPKLELTVKPSKMTAADRENNKSLLGTIMDISDKLDGDTIHVTVSCKQFKGDKDRKEKMGLDQNALYRAAEEAYGLHKLYPNAMRARFIARDEVGQIEDVLSFTGQRLEYVRAIPESSGTGRKYPLEEKLKVLYEALDVWDEIL